jgi:hypothetical protein
MPRKGGKVRATAVDRSCKRSASTANPPTPRSRQGGASAPATAVGEASEIVGGRSGTQAGPASRMDTLLARSLVLGRRQRRLDITLARGSITDVQATCYVLALFKNVGAAGATNAIDRPAQCVPCPSISSSGSAEFGRPADRRCRRRDRSRYASL